MEKPTNNLDDWGVPHDLGPPHVHHVLLDGGLHGIIPHPPWLRQVGSKADPQLHSGMAGAGFRDSGGGAMAGRGFFFGGFQSHGIMGLSKNGWFIVVYFMEDPNPEWIIWGEHPHLK